MSKLSIGIVGLPNVGKSSLMNSLARSNRVIVTPFAGTTRDVVEEVIQLRGFPLRLKGQYEVSTFRWGNICEVRRLLSTGKLLNCVHWTEQPGPCDEDLTEPRLNDEDIYKDR